MNRHLNLFEFFNDHDTYLYEDNLSRAFAICLKYDTVFLKSIFQVVLTKDQQERLFNTDFPNCKIDIDLQKKSQDLRECNELVAVACSVSEIDFSNAEEIKAGGNSDTITDVSLTIDDICIIFEFKITGEDCSAQLKGQVLDILNDVNSEIHVHYVDLNWHKIVKELLQVQSMQKLIESTNPFSDSLIKFLNRKYPEWFPTRPLANIPFPNKDVEDDPNRRHLINRLNQIKEHLARQLGTVTEDIGSRKAISIDWHWAKEINIDSEDIKDQAYITIRFNPGDTKAQGWHLFKKNKNPIEWEDYIEDVELDVDPYFKFSHFTSGILWHFVDKDSESYKKAFNYDFFSQFAGRYQKESWKEFNQNMIESIESWKSEEGFKRELLDTNRTYFDFSIGIRLRAKFAYDKCRKLDKNLDSKGLSDKFMKVILAMKDVIDNQANAE